MERETCAGIHAKGGRTVCWRGTQKTSGTAAAVPDVLFLLGPIEKIHDQRVQLLFVCIEGVMAVFNPVVALGDQHLF